MQYVFGDLDINLSIAVDFTASNKQHTDPSSLHNMNPIKNDYYQAIK